MEAAELSGALPFTAWEQAVFVALFIVFVIALLAWFGKQQEKWQNFIGKQNSEWRGFLQQQDTAHTSAMREVTDALKGVIEKIDDHDRASEERINRAVDTVSRKNARAK